MFYLFYVPVAFEEGSSDGMKSLAANLLKFSGKMTQFEAIKGI